VDPALEARGLACERSGRTLFRGLSLSLSGGELLRVSGENGSGKTSLLRVLCGLLSPSAGEVRWHGEPIGSLKEDYAAALVYLGHAPAVKDELTAEENLSIACELAGHRVSDAAVKEALAEMGAPPARPVRRMSQGQRRRAALARLLLSADKPLWLLDEPFAALDVAAVGLVERTVSAHLGRGGIVVLTTHQDTGLAPTRVVELQAGG
jgi:heme exporter protein A